MASKHKAQNFLGRPDSILRDHGSERKTQDSQTFDHNVASNCLSNDGAREINCSFSGSSGDNVFTFGANENTADGSNIAYQPFMPATTIMDEIFSTAHPIFDFDDVDRWFPEFFLLRDQNSQESLAAETDFYGPENGLSSQQTSEATVDDLLILNYPAFSDTFQTVNPGFPHMVPQQSATEHPPQNPIIEITPPTSNDPDTLEPVCPITDLAVVPSNSRKRRVL